MYHADGPPVYPWTLAMETLLQYGAVISTDRVFIAGRRLRVDDPDEVHKTLSPLESPEGADCWNIWIAAGSLASLVELVPWIALPWVSYYRRGGGRLRRVPTAVFLRRHELPKNAAAPAAPAAARDKFRP
jgi:hypothetical protein